jgi:hypothetical protein
VRSFINCTLPHISSGRSSQGAGHVACVGDVIMPEGKRPLGKTRHRWEDGLRMDIMGIGWGL